MSWEDLWPLLLTARWIRLYGPGGAVYRAARAADRRAAVYFPRNGLAPMPKLNALLGAMINIGRSLPFIVLLIALIPLPG
jgi:D-methionine transport system permease protein